MLLPDGSRLGAVDAMTEGWTGKEPQNQCPRILSLGLDQRGPLLPGQTVEAKLTAMDPEGDPLTIRWYLRADSAVIGVGGDHQQEEASIPEAVSGSGLHATITLPREPGAYRLFAYVYDDHQGAAVTNLPLYIQKIGTAAPAEGSKVNQR